MERSTISARAFPALTAVSALMRMSREAFLSTILLAPARIVWPGDKMEFDMDLMIPDKTFEYPRGCHQVIGWQSCTNEGSFSRAILDALERI